MDTYRRSAATAPARAPKAGRPEQPRFEQGCAQLQGDLVRSEVLGQAGPATLDSVLASEESTTVAEVALGPSFTTSFTSPVLAAAVNNGQGREEGRDEEEEGNHVVSRFAFRPTHPELPSAVSLETVEPVVR